MKKSSWITLVVIILVLILAYWLINRDPNGAPEDIAKCIGENAVLYTQLGCPACETQEEKFGENKKHLNIVDCFFELEKCSEIERTPTWIIDGKKYVGIQSIEKLQELTGC